MVVEAYLTPESPRSSCLWGEGRDFPDSSLSPQNTHTQLIHSPQLQFSLVASMGRRGQAGMS